jgi:hypothetical protein
MPPPFSYGSVKAERTPFTRSAANALHLRNALPLSIAKMVCTKESVVGSQCLLPDQPRRLRTAATALGLLLAGHACAQTIFAVNSTADAIDDNTSDDICHTAAGTCTLRAATMQANRVTSPGGAIITVPAGIYLLTIPNGGILDPDSEGDLNLTPPTTGSGPGPVITITGAGAASTIIDGNGIDGVLRINYRRTAQISGVTVRNGKNSDLNTGTLGGGIRNAGNLTLQNVVVRDNEAPAGGGIYNNNELVIYDSTIESNHATNNNGGGIENQGQLAIVATTIDSNSAVGGGGGIDNADLMSMFLTSSTLSQNDAGDSGGGIHNAGTSNIYNVTIAFNEADADGNSVGTGAGVDNVGNGVFNLRNSVIAGNAIQTAHANKDCSGTLHSYGRNKLSDSAHGNMGDCTVLQTGSGNFAPLASTDELGPLHDNGGPTRTHAIVPPSDMIDGADVTSGCIGLDGNALTTDQRGYPRIAGARCDIGAFEYSDVVFRNGFEWL